jgi:hypothetical protein
MCGKDAIIRDAYDTKTENRQRLEDSPTSNILEEQINGISYTFDTVDCAMMFKRFSSVYGSNFADE